MNKTPSLRDGSSLSLRRTDLVPELLDHGVVGVLVGNVEGGVDGAPVGILNKVQNVI